MTIARRPKPGEAIELAIWLTGEEPGEMLRRFHADMEAEFKAIADQYLLLLGPLSFTAKKPGDHRVPPVPPHIHGIDVRLMVVEAEVLKWLRPQTKGPGFVADLRSDDLQVLRKATRRAHAKAHPGMPPLPDANCDAVIEDMGPETAMAIVRRGVNASLH